MQDTVKLASRIFSVSHSAYNGHTPKTQIKHVLFPTTPTRLQKPLLPTTTITMPQKRDTNLPLCIAEYDSLCDRQCIIEITECVKLPLLLFHGNKELLDTLKRQLIT